MKSGNNKRKNEDPQWRCTPANQDPTSTEGTPPEAKTEELTSGRQRETTTEEGIPKKYLEYNRPAASAEHHKKLQMQGSLVCVHTSDPLLPLF